MRESRSHDRLLRTADNWETVTAQGNKVTNVSPALNLALLGILGVLDT